MGAVPVSFPPQEMTTIRNERFVQLPIKGYSDDTGVATARIVSFDRKTRVRKAMIGLAASWGAAALSVFIPVAHFLLVPAFVGFGLYLLFHNLRLRVSAQQVTGTCPDCSAEQEFEVSGNWSPPHRVTCNGCQRSLVLGTANNRPTS